ncbi:hypothetical protein [Ramlibacter sp.]|uniref:hypothetical protein n=1 Tax=Ramlibacter sp. TaxID=1917967 RepID=UPI003D0C5561
MKPAKKQADPAEELDAASGAKRPGRVLLKLPDELRASLQRSAFVGHRTLTAEITMRLASTFTVADFSTSHRVAEPAPQLGGLTAEDRLLIERFRDLPEEKQRALLALLA